MEIEEFVERRLRAVEQFNRHEGRDDGIRVATSLADGMNEQEDASAAAGSSRYTAPPSSPTDSRKPVLASDRH